MTVNDAKADCSPSETEAVNGWGPASARAMAEAGHEMTPDVEITAPSGACARENVSESPSGSEAEAAYEKSTLPAWMETSGMGAMLGGRLEGTG